MSYILHFVSRITAVYCPISFKTVDSVDYKKTMLFYEQNNIIAFKEYLLNSLILQSIIILNSSIIRRIIVILPFRYKADSICLYGQEVVDDFLFR